MRIFLAIATFGCYDNADFSILYVGLSELEATEAAKNFHFPDPYQNFSLVEVWEDGKKILQKEITF